MKEIQIAAGCRTRIIQRRFSSLAMTYSFNAAPTAQDGDVAGVVEVKGSDWIFPKPGKQVPLQQVNTVKAGMWDTFFSVYVTPESDVYISLPSRSLGRRGLWLVGAVMAVVLIAIAFFIVS